MLGKKTVTALVLVQFRAEVILIIINQKENNMKKLNMIKSWYMGLSIKSKAIIGTGIIVLVVIIIT